MDCRVLVASRRWRMMVINDVCGIGGGRTTATASGRGPSMMMRRHDVMTSGVSYHRFSRTSNVL